MWASRRHAARRSSTFTLGIPNLVVPPVFTMLTHEDRCIAGHQHHVTYDPEVVRLLYRRHHEDITIINGQQARKYRRSSSNRHRWWTWYQWLRGELKRRRTSLAMEYIEDWD